MAKLPGAFNAKENEKMGDFSPMPPGNYVAMIDESSLEDTKAGDGKYIKFRFNILDGDYAGRKLWTNLNIVNPNPVAVEIANKALATIAEICGVDTVTDTEAVHGKPMLIKVTIRPENAQYPASNEIKGFKAAEGQTVASTAPSAEGGDVPKPAVPAAGSLPWSKKEA